MNKEVKLIMCGKMMMDLMDYYAKIAEDMVERKEVYWRSPTSGETFCISHITDIMFAWGIGDTFAYGELSYRLYYNTLHGIESKMVYRKLRNDYGIKIRNELLKAKEDYNNGVTLFITEE